MSIGFDPSMITGMPLLIPDANVSAELIEERRARGIDHHDEVWEGVYVVSPIANNEHQDLVFRLSIVLFEAVDRAGLGRSFPGVNVSDRKDNWTKNFRCPDVVTFLKGNPAVDCGTHWLGGPDLAIEIVSKYDRSRDKFGFYEQVSTRELLLVDRDPWQLELLRLTNGKLISQGVSTPEAPLSLVSEQTQLSFRLMPGGERPQIAIAHTGDGRTWTV